MFLNKKNKQKVYPKGNYILFKYIEFDGKKIKPVFNDKVLTELVEEIKHLSSKKPVKTEKFMNLHHSNFLVYLSLKEGARLQNIEFKYTTNELFFFIDYLQYANVLALIHKDIPIDTISPLYN